MDLIERLTRIAIRILGRPISNATAASRPYFSIRSAMVGTWAASVSGSNAAWRNSMYWNRTAWHWGSIVSKDRLEREGRDALRRRDLPET